MNVVTTHAAVSSRSSTSSIAVPGHSVSLAAGKIFAGYSSLRFLTEEDLYALMQRSSIRTLRRRASIFRHGDPGRTVILVLQGYVKLSINLADGREVMLEVLGTGGSIGEIAVLNQWSREADATTLSHCRLLSIDGRQFRQVVERSPEGLLAITQLVSKRLQRALEQVVDALALSAPARLAKVILQLAKLQSSDPDQASSIRLRLSQSEIGSMAGMTCESVNKHLGVWREAGWILLSGGAVTLVDPVALESLLEEEGTPSDLRATG